LIFRYNESTFQTGNGLSKEKFYASQNITPWNSGYDKNTIISAVILGAAVMVYFIIKSLVYNA